MEADPKIEKSFAGYRNIRSTTIVLFCGEVNDLKLVFIFFEAKRQVQVMDEFP